jgi:hypothetical protein
MGAKNKFNKPVKNLAIGNLIHKPIARFNPLGKISFNLSQMERSLSFDHPNFTADHYTNFCDSLITLSGKDWQDGYGAGKHTRIGSESLEISKFNKSPAISRLKEEGHEKLLVFRYFGNLPMVGLRKEDVFYVLFLESKYDDLYIHDSKRSRNFR